MLAILFFSFFNHEFILSFKSLQWPTRVHTIWPSLPSPTLSCLLTLIQDNESTCRYSNVSGTVLTYSLCPSCSFAEMLPHIPPLQKSTRLLLLHLLQIFTPTSLSQGGLPWHLNWCCWLPSLVLHFPDSPHLPCLVLLLSSSLSAILYSLFHYYA